VAANGLTVCAVICAACAQNALPEALRPEWSVFALLFVAPVWLFSPVRGPGQRRDVR
jgi:hypothetical protein